jgi:HAD superfamily hydrolase (TIGR01509 family)
VRRTWPVAAVFDCDGLLVDSEHCWHAAYRATAAAVGRSLEGVSLAAFNGASVGLAAERLSRALALPVRHELLRAQLLRAVQTLPVRPLPGVERLLAVLGRELPLAVASNGPAAAVETLLQRTGLRGHFTVVVSAEQTPAPKPYPHVYLEACRRLDVDPSDAIALEDSATGVAAARAAGLLVVAVPSGRDTRIDADLTVGQLDDERVLSLFGQQHAAR